MLHLQIRVLRVAKRPEEIGLKNSLDQPVEGYSRAHSHEAGLGLSLQSGRMSCFIITHFLGVGVRSDFVDESGTEGSSTVYGVQERPVMLRPPRPIDPPKAPENYHPPLCTFMASFVRHFSRSLLQASRRTPTKRKCNSRWPCTAPQCRTFSITSPWLAEGNENHKAAPTDAASSSKNINVFTPADFTPEERADFEQLSKDEQVAELARINAVQEALDNGELDGEIDADVAEIARTIDQEAEPLRFVDYRARGQEVGFWADDEDDEFGQVEDDDDDFNEEDITSVAHSELEVHREMREYARIVAWDMPLLKSMLAQLAAGLSHISSC